jgi:hypothetical protein
MSSAQLQGELETLGFHIDTNDKARADETLDFFLERVKERCYSDEAAAAAMRRVRTPQELFRYSTHAVSVAEAIELLFPGS